MARLFGEFLVQQNLVSTAQVLEALMTQIREMPTYAEVCYEKGLISDDILLRILASQQRHGQDFRSAAEDAGVWNEGVADRISKFLRAKHRPIGQILVDLGYMTLETLTTALADYVEELSKGESIPDAVAQVPKEFEPEIVAQFLAAYRERFKPAMEKILLEADRGDETQDGILHLTRRLIAEVSAFKGAAEFLGARNLTELANRVLATLNLAVDSTSFAHFIELRDIAKISFHIFDGCSEAITQFSTDNVFSYDPNISDLRERLLKELSKLETKLGLGRKAG